MLLPLILALPLLAAAPARQAASDSDAVALLADDLRFAEALAVNRFYGIATEVVDRTHADISRLAKGDVELAGDASLVRARIMLRRAESTADAAARLADLDAAIDALQDWAKPGSTFAFLERMVDALEELARALRLRGQEMALLAANGDGAARDRANADFKEADETYQAVQREAESRRDQLLGEDQVDAAEAMRVRAYTTFFARGLNSVEWAEVATDRDFRLGEAIDLLDEFGWEASNESLTYYSAIFEQARAHAKLGDVDTARQMLESLLENGAWLWDGLQDFPGATQRLIVGLMDDIWSYQAQVAAEAGDLQAAIDFISAMQARHADKKVPIGREGHRGMLNLAVKLHDLGRTADASDLAKRVADEGAGTPEGGRAQGYLGSWVSSGALVIESPEALMFAADGRRAAKEFADAAYLYQQATARLDTPERRAALAFDAWMGAGASLQGAGRLLEAAIAYEQALDAAQEFHAQDVDRIESAATGMYEAYSNRFGETQDPFDKRLRDAASQRVLAIPGIELDVQFRKADEAFKEIAAGDTQRYLAVLAEFEAVPETSSNYERARVASARCLQGAGRLEEALARFAEVEARAADPAFAPVTEAARAKREAALAQARYFHAALLLDSAVNRPVDALKVLEGFESQAPSQVSFHPLVQWQRTVAHALAGQVEEAEAALAELQQMLGDSQPTLLASGAFRVAQALRAVSSAAREKGDLATADAVGLRAAEALTLYCEASRYESYVNLLTAAEWFLEVQEYARGQELFQKALAVHEKTPGIDLDDARMGLARSYDLQADFGRARPLWLDVLTRKPRVPSVRTGAARSLGGWLELKADGSIVEIPGSGDYDKAYEIWVDLYKDAGQGGGKYSSYWWQAKLGVIDSLYRRQVADPEKGRNAGAVLDQLKLLLPNYDADTIGQLDDEQKYSPLYQPFFRYLDGKIRR